MNETASPRKETITIKKYANRRLYNTATSSYVTLETLAAMVKEGVEFNVYDAKTSEDITRSVLTQIIVEEEGKSGQQNLLPISFLRQLIGFYGDNMQWLVPKYLEHSMQMLANNQEQLSNYFQAAFGNMFPFGGTLEEMGKQNLAMFERAMRMFSPFAAMESKLADSDRQAGTGVKVKVEEERPAAEDRVTVVSAEPEEKSGPAADSSAAAACNIAACSVEKPSAVPESTPMPNVQSARAASFQSSADDMQQKIANLQRQLAELAKKGA